MKRDEYGPRIEALLAGTDDGLSVAEIVEEVGCSRQRVYNWVSKNRHRIRTTGRSDQGAARYTMRDTSEVTGRGVSIGDHVVIRSMRLTGETLMIGLEAEDGTELIATVHAD